MVRLPVNGKARHHSNALPQARPRRRAGLAVGVVVTASSVVLLAANLMAPGTWAAGRFWPLLVVGFGLSQFLNTPSRRSGLLVVAVGVWVQLANFGLYNLRPAAIVRYWPLLLVAAGGLQIVSYVGLRDLAEGAGAVLLGLWLQASYFGLVHISSYRLWPLILTAVGLELSLSSFRRGPSDAFRGE